MEDVSDRFSQSSSMNRARAMTLMEALATLHAHFWGRVGEWDRGSFWTVDRRRHRGG
jgi:hypothetical protein